MVGLRDASLRLVSEWGSVEEVENEIDNLMTETAGNMAADAGLLHEVGMKVGVAEGLPRPSRRPSARNGGKGGGVRAGRGPNDPRADGQQCHPALRGVEVDG